LSGLKPTIAKMEPAFAEPILAIPEMKIGTPKMIL
jgi:hypothetical protein